jgi:hypothetical protein
MMMILLLASVLPAATWAQSPQPGQGSAKPGANLCGHEMDAATFVDARAQNATHEEAVVMRWLDPKGTAVHSALFMGRCVAKDGDDIDGKLIVRVLPNSLAISNKHGLTAWEAEYWDSPAEKGWRGTPHRGIFSDGRLVTELDPAKASEPGVGSAADPDFHWNEEAETVAVKPGIALVPVTPAYAFRNPPPPPAKSNCTPQAQQTPKVSVKAPPKASAWACQHLGICPDNKPVVIESSPGCPATPAGGQPAK